MNKNSEIANEVDLKIEKTTNNNPSTLQRVSLSIQGEPQITPEELISRDSHLYGKPSVCQKL